MKDDQYINGLRKMTEVIAVCLLLLPIKLFPANYLLEADIGKLLQMDCPTPIVVANDPGVCYAFVSFIPPPNAYLVSGQGPNTNFNVGITTIQYNLNDDSDSCTFTVTVYDEEPPLFEFCPDDIIKSYDDGICQTVYYEMPVAADNCGISAFYQSAGLTSGSVFPIGVTTNEFIAIDDAGNTTICSFAVTINGENSTVLPTNGSNSKMLSPQGESRYQRAFYLITKEEMNQSDLSDGMEINSIGFTIGVAQNSRTYGNFKLFLENTTDTLSRIDSIWVTQPSLTNSLTLNGLEAGEYEWQVKSSCTNSGGYSQLSGFANDELDGCNQPFNLRTVNITTATATISWELPILSSFDEFEIIYGLSSSADRDTVYASTTTYDLAGLSAEENYQWSVRSICTGKNSPLSSSYFTTESPDLCEKPTSLSFDGSTESTITVSWTGNNASAHYNIAYRRKGTTMWLNAFSFSNAHTFTGLAPGTFYEWKVKTVCDAGSGAYVEGLLVSTAGPIVCYPPEGLEISELSSSGVTLSWQEVPEAVSYIVSYRLKESIAWSNVTYGMDLVSDGLITIPDTIGSYDIPFESGSPFSYTGNSLYVAWEYSNPSDPVSSANTTLCTDQHSFIKGVNGVDSVMLIRSFYGRTNSNSTALPSNLRATNLRPETRLGSPTLKDSVEVTAVYTLGHVAIPYVSPVPVSAMIKNFSNKPKTYTVTLDIYNTETLSKRFTKSQDLDVPASCGELIIFSDWIPVETGLDSIVVSIPAQPEENVVDNNSNFYMQTVNRVMQSYADEAPVINGAGFDKEEGLILSRLSMNGCGKINGVKVYLHFSAAGNPLYAVVVDTSGTILDISDQITLDSTQVNNYYSFFFPNAPLIVNDDYYVGLAQMANTTKGYNPVGVQWEGNVIRDGAYYRAGLDGSNIVDHPYPGRLMIKAEIIPGMPVPFISGSNVLCDGNTNTLQSASKTTRYADKVLSVSSELSPIGFGAIQILGTPDVYPEYGANMNAWNGATADAQREYINLHFPDAGKINFIDIYQTLNPGAIDTVYTIDSIGNKYLVYANPAQQEPQQASIKEIRFDLTTYNVSEIRIALSSESIPGYNAIDAVGIGIINDHATFSSYLWEPSGENTPAIDVSSDGIYKLTVTNSLGCQMMDSIEVSTPILEIPVVSASGSLEFCQGASVILYSDMEGGNTWSTGETTDSIAVSEAGTYNVTYNNGCEDATSSDVVVTVWDLPQVSFTGGPICQGGTTTISVVGNFPDYLWSTGDSSQSILVSGPGNYEVTVTDDNGCKASGSISSFYAPSPYPVISGDPFFCPGDSSLLDAGSGYSAYLWSTGETTRKAYVKTSGTVSVVVTNAHGCTGLAGTISGEYIPPQPFISGALSLCYGSAAVLHAGDGYASYLWSTGEMTSAIVVDTADTFTVTVTDDHGCQGSASTTTSLDGAIPDIPGPITGPVRGICMKNGLVYSIDPVLNSTHYVWTVPEGMNIVSGQGTPHITADAAIVTSGTISVAASNTCGQSASWNGRTLTVHGTADVPGVISGPENGICGLSGVTYSVDAVYGASTYLWTVPAGANITSGNGTSSISVSFDPTFSSGKICVATTNDCGTSEQACIIVNSKPAIPGNIAGPIEVCRKQKNVNYIVDPVFNADTYIWTVPLQSSIKSGQGTPNIVVDFGNKSGNITVRTENGCGLSSIQSLPVEVVMCNNNGVVINMINPPNNPGNPYLNSDMHSFYPEVIANAGGFAMGNYFTISWTLGEPMIETRETEKNKLSQGFHQSYYLILPLGEQSEEILFEVNVYPVPTRDLVNIHILAKTNPLNLILELFNQKGDMVYREDITSREYNHQLDLERYPSSMFLLRVTDTQNSTWRLFKVIKLR